MSSRSSFSLNTIPVESDGGSPTDSIDESFWQIHLWPNSTPTVDPKPPLPENIFGQGSTSGGTTNETHLREIISDANLNSPLVLCLNGSGGGGGVPEKADDRQNVGKRRRLSDTESSKDHVNGERERRKKMKSMFTSLHDLLPNLPPKVDKSTIVNEAINLIKTLEDSLQTLQQKVATKHPRVPRAARAIYEPPTSTGPQLKLASMTTRESFLADHGSDPIPKALAHKTVENGAIFNTWTSSNVVLNTFGKNEALIMACSPKKHGLLAAIVGLLAKHKVEVENVHAFSNEVQCSYMIHGHLANGAFEQRLNSTTEEVYKQVARELVILLSGDNNNTSRGA